MAATVFRRSQQSTTVEILDLRHFSSVDLRPLLEQEVETWASALCWDYRNSADMIESLTLYMNKLRQAAITREIIEVVSGAQAL